MSITIKTEAGQVQVEAGIGRVVVNGASMLAHEAAEFASVLFKAGNEARKNADKHTGMSVSAMVDVGRAEPL